MHLKEIEILGFKTFAEKTSIKFSPTERITAIVGPNGCGKSNLVDSFRWVMGEQSLKLLRGSVQEEIIFSGSETTKPLSLAEVTLTLDNTDHYLNLDFSEVTIRRRVFRSGESGFFINRAECRLKDIQRLFLDTGIGRNTYAIVNQGQIDAILNSKPEDRRAIFEEVAGINKYRTQKNESLTKLAATEANLLRVSDLMGEIKNQIDPLKIQAEKANQYKALKGELEKIEVNLLCAELQRIIKRREKNEEILKNIRARVLEIERTQQEQMAEKSRLAGESSLINEKIDSQRNDLLSLRSEIEKNRAELTINQERQNFLEERENSLNRELEQLSKEAAELEGHLREFSKPANLEMAELKTQEESIGQLSELVVELTRKLEEQTQQIEKEAELLLELERQLSANKNTLLEVEAAEKIIHGERRHEQNLKEELIQKISDLKNKQVALEQVLLETGESKQKILEELAAKKSKGQQELTRKDYLETQVAQTQKELNRFSAQCQLLKEMTSRLTRPAASAREILLAFKQGKIPGSVMGIFGELIKAPPEVEKLINLLLGGKLHFLVVTDLETVRTVKKYAENQNLAEYLGFFVPGLVNKKIRLESQLPPEIKGRVSDLVTGPANIRVLLEALLGDYLLVENEAVARTLINNGFFDKYSWVRGLVALGDSFISAFGELIFGKPTTGLEIFLAPGQLEKLSQEETRFQTQLANFQSELNSFKQGFCEDEKAQHEQTIAVKITEMKMAGLAEEKDRRAEEIFGLEGELEIIEKNLKIRAAEIEAQEKRKTEILGERTGLENRKREIESQMKDRQSTIENFKNELALKNPQLINLKMELARKSGRYSQIKEEKEALSRRLLRIAGRIKEMESEKIANLAKLENLKKDRLVLTQKMPQLAEKEAALLKTESEFGSARLKISRSLEELEKRALKTLESKTLLENEANEIKIRLAEIEVVYENFQERLLNEYELNVDEIKLEDYLVEDLTEVKPRVERLRQQIHRLEPVNLLAIEELAALEERLHFLETQKKDLVEATENLTALIRKLDNQAKKELLESIKLVNNHFSRIFSRIFSGGSSQLTPVDAENILEAGIEIMVQLPGKRRQNLTLLSGGERALTSAALLFAMLEARPAPFCILDEVDAPLDENNVDRFIELLKEFSQKSQILIITHSRRTIAAANVIYGVTMETPGISKVFSLKLGKVEEVLGQ